MLTEVIASKEQRRRDNARTYDEAFDAYADDDSFTRMFDILERAFEHERAIDFARAIVRTCDRNRGNNVTC